MDEVIDAVEERARELSRPNLHGLPASLDSELPDPEVWSTFTIARSHEFLHWRLAESAMIPALTRSAFWGIILELAQLCEGVEVVTSKSGTLELREAKSKLVPLNIQVLQAPKKRYPLLEAFVQMAVDGTRLAEPVEELIALWGSLYKAKEARQISEGERIRRENLAALRYEREIPGFARKYFTFKNFAETLCGLGGFEAVFDFVTLAMLSLYPEARMATLMEYFSHAKSKTDVDRLFESIPEESDPFYGALDAKGSDVPEDVERAIQLLYVSGKLFGNIPLEESMKAPEELTVLFYAPSGTLLFDRQTEVKDLRSNPSDGLGVQFVWFESLRQQMTQGIGLECPFWRPGECCGRFKDLQGLWLHTKLLPGALGPWVARGCLAG